MPEDLNHSNNILTTKDIEGLLGCKKLSACLDVVFQNLATLAITE